VKLKARNNLISEEEMYTIADSLFISYMAALRDFELALTFIFALALALIAQNCARANALKRFRKIALKFKILSALSIKIVGSNIADHNRFSFASIFAPQSRRKIVFF
jgi:hypothetical protein